MKFFKKISLLLATALVVSVSACAAQPSYTVEAAGNIDYVTQRGYVVNWGERGEECTFLSDYAEDFYTGSYTFEAMSRKSGGTAQNNAPSSALYKGLQDMMKTKHTHTTSYAETKDLYKYTDCENNDYAHITSFYSAKQLNGAWDSAATWNREHTWPQSKGLNGGDENDIMMLRPTWVEENSSRGNTAYGASSGYFDPAEEGGADVRGDCARIVLYVYVRWGNTNNMWGKSGVMESMNVLLDWMEEDPVDTWEMGRNDAVESITGTRNAFVDYPEYAWLLFGKEVPENMSTPSNGVYGGTGGGSSDSSSGNTSNSSSSMVEPDEDSSASDSVEDSNGHDFSDWITITEATETTDGLMMRSCYTCGETEEKVIPRTGDFCEHDFSDWIVVIEPTETVDGLQMRTCYTCGEGEEEILPKTGGDSVDSEGEEIAGSDVESEIEEDPSNSEEESVSEEISEGGENSTDGNGDAAMGCAGAISLPFMGAAVLTVAGLLMKRRKDEE